MSQKIAKHNIFLKARWYRLIPIAFITYSLAYLDRANFGFGTAGGMADDLNISAGMLSLLASLFFLGYFFYIFKIAHVLLYITSKNTLALRGSLILQNL